MENTAWHGQDSNLGPFAPDPDALTTGPQRLRALFQRISVRQFTSYEILSVVLNIHCVGV